MRQLLLAIIPLLFVATTVTNVYAGGPRHDYPENLEDIPGAPECWTDGFDAGANNLFNKSRDEECKDKGDLYTDGFNAGQVCNDPERSIAFRDDCERAKSMPNTVGECSDLGFEHGKEGEWDTGIESKCVRLADHGNPYRNALEDGCYAAGNPREYCQEINH